MQIDSLPTDEASNHTSQNPIFPPSSSGPAHPNQKKDKADNKNRRRLFPTPSPVGTSTVNPPAEEEEIQDFTPNDTIPKQAESTETQDQRQLRGRKNKENQARPTSKPKAGKAQAQASLTTPGPAVPEKQARITTQPPGQTLQINNPAQDPTHIPNPIQASSSSPQITPPIQAPISKKGNHSTVPTTARAVRSSERVSRARSIIDLCATF